jgi:hypothetical protein
MPDLLACSCRPSGLLLRLKLVAGETLPSKQVSSSLDSYPSPCFVPSALLLCTETPLFFILLLFW